MKASLARYAPRVRGKSAREALAVLQIWSEAPPSPNLLKNPDLQPAADAGSTPGLKAGLPPGWDFWKNARGETAFGMVGDVNVLRLTGADSAAFCKSIR